MKKKKDELFTKWRHKNISKHHLDLCAIRVCFHLIHENMSVLQLHSSGFEYRVLKHHETLTSTIHNKILREEETQNVDKADPNVEDKNSAFFGIKV